MRPASPGSSTWAASSCIRTRCARAISIIPTSCASISIPVRASRWADVRTVALEVKALLEEMGLRGWPKTSGSRGMHINVRIQPRWTFAEVRRAAVALSRAVERRVPALASSKVVERGAPRRLPRLQPERQGSHHLLGLLRAAAADARVSTPLDWSEVPDCDPADFTVLTVPKRFAELGDPHAGMDDAPGSLEQLLELAARDEAAGLGDAPWPPHFRKMEGEAPRVAPSRARPPQRNRRRATKMPLIVVANSPDKEAALAGLERWKSKYPEAAALSRRGRRAGRFHARPLLHLDAHSRQPAPRARRRCVLRRKRPIRMTIPRASGASMRGGKSGETASVSARSKKLPPVRAAAPLRAVRKCNRSAFYPCATCETAPCAGSANPACVRTRLPPPVPAAAAPRKDPCPGSSGSVRPACVVRLLRGSVRGPSLSRMIDERVLAIGRQKVHQLPALLLREAGAHADVLQRACSRRTDPAAATRSRVFSPFLCQRKPATTQSQSRSCLTLNITRLSGS